MSDIVTKLDNTEEPLLRLENLSIDYRTVSYTHLRAHET